MSIRILVVEDEAKIADFLVRGLREEGYAVEHAADGGSAWGALRSGGWDLVLLDWWLPGEDGLALLQRFRRLDRQTPVLFLTARDAVDDRVRGLDAGADDYLAKPFGLAELLARLRALLRRTTSGAGAGGADRRLAVDVDAHRVRVGDQEVALTGKEFDVLAVLVASRDKVVSRGQLMAEVWSEAWYGSTKTLDVTIGRLRKKLERAGTAERVVTVRGVGFRLES